MVLSVMENVMSSVSKGYAAEIISGGVPSLIVQLMNPSTLIAPFSLNTTDLHPVSPSGLGSASYFIFNLLWMGTMLTTLLIIGTTVPKEKGLSDKSGLMATRLTLFRLFFTVLFMFILSLMLTTGIAVYGGTFKYGFGVMVVWLWYCGVSFLSINLFLANIIGVPQFSPLSILLMMLQMASGGGLMTEALQPQFFLIGQGLPFFYAVRGARTIMFGSLENYMLTNALVLMAFIICFGSLYFFIARTRVLQRWAAIRQSPVGQALSDISGATTANPVVI